MARYNFSSSPSPTPAAKIYSFPAPLIFSQGLSILYSSFLLSLLLNSFVNKAGTPNLPGNDIARLSTAMGHKAPCNTRDCSVGAVHAS